MSPEEAFRAVIDHPENAYCRMLYARAIARTDPSRSAYIRWHFRVSKRWDRPGVFPPLRSKDIAIILADNEAQRSRIDSLARFPLREKHEVIGFVEFIWMDAADFLQYAAELYQLAPILSVRLDGVKPVARELFASPNLARLKRLDVSRNQLDDNDVQMVAESPFLQRLEYLCLSRNNFTRVGLEALYASSNLPNVKVLSLFVNPDPHLNPGMAEDELMVTGSWFEPFVTQLQQKYGDRAWMYTPLAEIDLNLIFNNL